MPRKQKTKSSSNHSNSSSRGKSPAPDNPFSFFSYSIESTSVSDHERKPPTVRAASSMGTDQSGLAKESSNARNTRKQSNPFSFVKFVERIAEEAGSPSKKDPGGEKAKLKQQPSVSIFDDSEEETTIKQNPPVKQSPSMGNVGPSLFDDVDDDDECEIGVSAGAPGMVFDATMRQKSTNHFLEGSEDVDDDDDDEDDEDIDDENTPGLPPMELNADDRVLQPACSKECMNLRVKLERQIRQSTERERALREELGSAMTELREAKRREAHLLQQLNIRSQKDAVETQTLEQLMKKAEENLAFTTKRAQQAEKRAEELQRHLDEVLEGFDQFPNCADVQERLRRQNAILRQCRDEGRIAAEKLQNVAGAAGQQLVQLARHATSLKGIADTLWNLDRVAYGV